ncbi:hypothetical protein ACOSQ3_026916 [Xanthoceras sorbifolium]
MCGLWAVSVILCRHALACISKKRDAVEGYVHHYLKKTMLFKTYSHVMHPIPDEHLWPDVEFATVLPPLKRRRPGRPKQQRRRGLSSSLKCSICHEVGHNSRTCKKKNDGQYGGNQFCFAYWFYLLDGSDQPAGADISTGSVLPVGSDMPAGAVLHDGSNLSVGSVLLAGLGRLGAARRWISPVVGILKLNVDMALNTEK